MPALLVVLAVEYTEWLCLSMLQSATRRVVLSASFITGNVVC
jgi:hypothetical protein